MPASRTCVSHTVTDVDGSGWPNGWRCLSPTAVRAALRLLGPMALENRVHDRPPVLPILAVVHLRRPVVVADALVRRDPVQLVAQVVQLLRSASTCLTAFEDFG
jgi:hypothetical protein